MARVVRIARVDEVAAGTGKVVELNDKVLAVFNVNGSFYVIDNTCLHRGGPLGEGFLDGKIVTCPWHGWEYDVSTGENLPGRALKVNAYEVTVSDGDIIIEL